MLLYVDDLLVDGDDASVHEFLDLLSGRFKCNNPIFLTAETPIDFIGIMIHLSENKIELSMEPYCKKLLSEMGMENCTPRGTNFSHDIDTTSPLLSQENSRIYRSGVGGIGWLVNTLRPDLALPFSRLGSHLANPTESAAQVLKHCLRYIQGTKHYRISMQLDQEANAYDFYVDSDHGGNTEPDAKRKSQTGYLSTINGAPNKWKSQLQSITATSSAEAEIYAASKATQDFMHLSYITSELGITDFPSPFRLKIDNSAAIIFMEDSSRVSRLKHIDLRQNWVKQMRDYDVVQPIKVGTDDNLADLMTKPLSGVKLRKFCESIFNYSATAHPD